MAFSSQWTGIRITWDDLAFVGIADRFGPSPWLDEKWRSLVFGGLEIVIEDADEPVIQRLSDAVFQGVPPQIRCESPKWVAYFDVSCLSIEGAVNQPLKLRLHVDQSSPYIPTATAISRTA